MNEELIKKLIANMKCGICGQLYAESNIHILGHRDDLWFLGIFCPACHSQGLVAAVIKEGELPEVYAELSDEELTKFSQGEAVEANDVLDMHEFLKEFDGNFSAFFSRE